MPVQVPKLRTPRILCKVRGHFVHFFTPQLSQDIEFSVQSKFYRKLPQFRERGAFWLVGLGYNNKHADRAWVTNPSDRKRYRPWPERARFFVGRGTELETP